MRKIKTVVEKTTGYKYIVFDETGTEICILQTFTYVDEPRKRQLTIWRSKSFYTECEGWD